MLVHEEYGSSSSSSQGLFFLNQNFPKFNRHISGHLDTPISDYSTSPIVRCAFLCTILNESPEYHQLAFRIGLLGLEICRMPATTKALEVRLLNCEQEICQELKKITLGQDEIELLRQRAEHLCARLLNIRDDGVLLPLSLATYIFETLRSLSLYRMNSNSNSNLTLSQNFSLPSSLGNNNQLNQADELLAFDTAICALGAKCYISEGNRHSIDFKRSRKQ